MPATRPVRLWRSARVQRRRGPGKGASSFSAEAEWCCVHTTVYERFKRHTFLPIFVLLSITGADHNSNLYYTIIVIIIFLARRFENGQKRIIRNLLGAGKISGANNYDGRARCDVK